MSDFVSPPSPKFTVAYWSIRGIGAPLRMMAFYSKVPVKIVQYDGKMDPENGIEDRSAWFDKKKSMKLVNPFINLPYIIDHEREGGMAGEGDKRCQDLIVSQSNACLSYLGRRLGLWPREGDYIDLAYCETFLAEVMDLRNQMVAFAYRGDKSFEKTKEDGLALLRNVQNKNGSLQKFELWFERKDVRATAPFLLDYCTAPDFHLIEILSQYLVLLDWCGGQFGLLKTEFEQNFPKVNKYFVSFTQLPEMEAYFKSDLHAGTPFNNKGARWGSIPARDLKYGESFAFSKGQDYDWGKEEERIFNC